MDKKKAMSIIEAVLFAMGDSVEASKLVHVLEISEKEIREIIKEMNSKYKKAERGIYILELGDSFQLCTKPDLYEYLIKVAKAPRKYVMSDTLLETLSIIAYKQPVTKLEVEKIRGVSSDHAVNRLLEFNLIQELGRLDAPGRPLLFGTTEEFLRTFGVKTLGDLPRINPEQMEDFKKQAEEEADIKVEI
ncbi:MAG: SMC-Scp complex subunit ScpB [Lachnospiraceae bacterium]|nr:SMC-Scp complex subunit ScpB [Lachnospiraceae bacterium]MBQ2115291.1 SMC-Scp complex subunit ScpB [Lachnospiraceae bacterium]MBQ2406626.1 SMC-Scp complex subunit ScpB [Lachnospiraceae bacterium]MEE0920071.1 SMC-Scp complex subunit ScpB [Lachnospiraceae bacterium]